MKVYVVVDIGCLECGNATTVPLITSDREEAERVARELAGPPPSSYHEDYVREQYDPFNISDEAFTHNDSRLVRVFEVER